ncbi:hypothetical protein GCM10028819_04730 [Spirosoma humi]
MPGSRAEITCYTYDRGNAIKTEQTINPTYSKVQTIQYRHDDKPNLTFGLLIGTPNLITIWKGFRRKTIYFSYKPLSTGDKP